MALRDAAVGHGDTASLTNVTLAVQRGMRLLVVGANGSGKSTLLATLAGKRPPLAGSRQSMRWLQCLHWDAACRDAADAEEESPLEFVLRLADGGVETSEALALLDSVGIDRFASRRPCGCLSSGERTRLAQCSIALAPKHLLVLDEPAAFLASPAVESLSAALAPEAWGGALVVATHSRAAALAFRATHTAILRGGGVSLHPGTAVDADWQALLEPEDGKAASEAAEAAASEAAEAAEAAASEAAASEAAASEAAAKEAAASEAAEAAEAAAKEVAASGRPPADPLPRAASSSAARGLEACRSLLRWAAERGARTGSVAVRASCGGFGLFSAVPLRSGGVAFSCPVSCALTPGAALADETVGEELRRLRLTDEQLVCLYLLHCRRTPSSHFAPYLQALPSDDEAAALLPQLWPDGEERRARLAGTPLLQQAEAGLASLRAFHTEVVAGELCARSPDAFPAAAFSFRRLCWAHAMWASRAIRLELPGGARHCLVPLLDLMNHSPRLAASVQLEHARLQHAAGRKRKAAGAAEGDAGGAAAAGAVDGETAVGAAEPHYVVRCSAAVGEGEELCLNYGAKGNGEIRRDPPRSAEIGVVTPQQAACTDDRCVRMPAPGELIMPDACSRRAAPLPRLRARRQPGRRLRDTPRGGPRGGARAARSRRARRGGGVGRGGGRRLCGPRRPRAALVARPAQGGARHRAAGRAAAAHLSAPRRLAAFAATRGAGALRRRRRGPPPARALPRTAQDPSESLPAGEELSRAIAALRGEEDGAGPSPDEAGPHRCRAPSSPASLSPLTAALPLLNAKMPPHTLCPRAGPRA